MTPSRSREAVRRRMDQMIADMLVHRRSVIFG
jgi:hypothetical protein